MRSLGPDATGSLRDGAITALMCLGALAAFLASAELFFVREDHRLQRLWQSADHAAPLLPYLAMLVYVTAFAASIAAIVGVGELLTGNRAAPGLAEVLIASALGILATGMGFWGLAFRQPGVFVGILVAVVLSAVLTLLAGRAMTSRATTVSPAFLAAAGGTSISLFLSALASVIHAALTRSASPGLTGSLAVGGGTVTELEVAAVVAMVGALLAGIPVFAAMRGRG